MRESKHRGHSVRGYFGEYDMENLNIAPIADNFVDALVAERDAFRIQRDEMKALLASYQRDANLLRDQRGMWIAIMADPIREVVKKEFADIMADFDIADYADEIKEIAADGFDIADYADDILNSVELNMSDYSAEIGDVVRDVLSDAIIKLEV